MSEEMKQPQPLSVEELSSMIPEGYALVEQGEWILSKFLLYYMNRYMED